MRQFCKYVLLVMLIFNLSYAQGENEKYAFSFERSGFINNIKNDANNFIDVGTGFFKSPLYYSTEDYILSGLIISGTAFSMTFDNQVREIVSKNHNPKMDNITNIGEKFGNPIYGTALSGLIYFGGHLAGDDYVRETGQMLGEALLFNGIVTTGLKYVLGRSRPFLNEGNFEIDPFEMETASKDHSLPSGHTSTAFTIATVLSQRIKNIYASISLYSLAGLTAYQRIYSDKHWISDTILGAALGTVIGLKVVNLHSETNSARSNQLGINILPTVSSEFTGINIHLSF